jgi:Zn-dependent protease with chaperone function
MPDASLAYFTDPLDLLFRVLVDASLASIVILAIASYFLIPRAIRKMGLVPYENTEVKKLAEECAATAKLHRVPKLFMDKKSRVAFTVGRSGLGSAIAVNPDLVDSLDKEELKVLLFHEMGHIASGDVGLMTWATVFQKSLKYWLIAYIAIILVCVPIYFPPPEYVGDWVRFVFIGSGMHYSIFVPIAIYLFVTLSVKSAHRVREFNADEFAARHVKPASLLSFMRSAFLYFISSSAKLGISTKKRRRVFWRFRLRISSLFAHHPPLGARVRNIKQSLKDELLIRLPTIESSIFAGIVAAIFAIGWLEFLQRSEPFLGLLPKTWGYDSFHDPIQKISYLDYWKLVSIPSIAVCAILNLTPIFRERRKLGLSGHISITNPVLKGYLVNLLVSSLCYFTLLTLVFHPLLLSDLFAGFSDFSYLGESWLEVLRWNSVNAALIAISSLGAFLLIAAYEMTKSIKTETPA